MAIVLFTRLAGRLSSPIWAPVARLHVPPSRLAQGLRVELAKLSSLKADEARAEAAKAIGLTPKQFEEACTQLCSQRSAGSSREALETVKLVLQVGRARAELTSEPASLPAEIGEALVARTLDKAGRIQASLIVTEASQALDKDPAERLFYFQSGLMETLPAVLDFVCESQGVGVAAYQEAEVRLRPSKAVALASREMERRVSKALAVAREMLERGVEAREAMGRHGLSDEDCEW
jgi:hypothetical protein